MSIETLLTLGLATAILVLAALLRLLVLGAARLGLRLSGRRAWWLEKPRRERAERAERPQRAALWPRLARGARSATAALGFLVSGVVEGLGIAVVGLARGADRTGAALAPRLRGASRSSASAADAAAAWLGPRLGSAAATSRRALASGVARVKPAVVLAIATVQHVAQLVVDRTRAWVNEREAERSARPGEATSSGDGPRVIDLDRDFDPLTDDFPEDRIGSSV